MTAYVIKDAWNGREYFESYKHTLRFMKAEAQRIADREDTSVALINTVRNHWIADFDPTDELD